MAEPWKCPDCQEWQAPTVLSHRCAEPESEPAKPAVGGAPGSCTRPAASSVPARCWGATSRSAHGDSGRERQRFERSLRARIAANARWSREDPRPPTAAPAKARAGLWERFLREVDPDGSLDPVERARRAECARRAYYQRLALASAKARRARSQSRSPSPSRRASSAARASLVAFVFLSSIS